METLLFSLAISLIINLVIFLPAYFFRTDKLTDISYALTFAVIAIFYFLTNEMTLPKAVLLLMILVWGGRLGGYLLIRIRKIGRDTRFDGMRESFIRFGRFWLLQAVSVWAIMLSSILFFSNSTFLNVLSFLGFSIWAAGFLLEAFADFQKFNFLNDSNNKDKWIESGLWKYSRHPNYLGEIMVWAGIYFFVAPSLFGIELLIGFISPLFVTILLIFVSGIPILEKKSDKKWGDNKNYQDYKKRVGVLIPKYFLSYRKSS